MKKKRPTHSHELRFGVFLLSLMFLIVFFGYVIESRTRIEIPEPEYIPASIPKPSPEEIVHGDTSKKQVIFTFDGGSGVGSTEQILDVLAQHHVKGTFFLTGKFVENNPLIVKRMVTEGHEVFNHTVHHPHLTELTDQEIAAELEGMDFLMTEIIGSSTRPYFRPPYGDRDDRVRHAAFAAGYQSVFWTVDVMDWKEGSGETNESVTARIMAHVAPGTLYLMHLGDSITGAVLDDVLTKIEALGYTPVSLTQGI